MTADTHRRTRNRAETRERVLDGAMEVFVERGFGRATPEQICRRAGFTRGAFYSSFSSMDEVFLALWQRQAGQVVRRVRDAVDSARYDPDDGRSFRDVVVESLSGLTSDPSWHVLMAEFGAHAARDPDVAAVVTAHRADLRDALLPLIIGVLRRYGREVNGDEDTLGRAVVAVYEGAMSQAMIEPDNPVPTTLALELVAAVIWTYSRESGSC